MLTGALRKRIARGTLPVVRCGRRCVCAPLTCWVRCGRDCRPVRAAARAPTPQAAEDEQRLGCLLPCHEDKRPSLSITEASNGNVLVKCHAGCRTEDVLVKLDLPMAVLFADHGEPMATPLRTAPTTTEREIVYDYRDEATRLGFQVVRQPGKNFRQRRPDGKGGWIWNLEGVGRVLYRLPELMATGTDHTVYLVEGEKDVETLRGLGEVATTNPGGAGKWRPEYTPALHGRHGRDPA